MSAGEWWIASVVVTTFGLLASIAIALYAGRRADTDSHVTFMTWVRWQERMVIAAMISCAMLAFEIIAGSAEWLASVAAP